MPGMNESKQKARKALENFVSGFGTTDIFGALSKINKLEFNWNELKKWLEKQINIDIDNIGAYESILQEVLIKMQELENGNNGIK